MPADPTGVFAWAIHWVACLSSPLAILTLGRWAGEWLAEDMQLGLAAPVPTLVAILVSVQIAYSLIGG